MIYLIYLNLSYAFDFNITCFFFTSCEKNNSPIEETPFSFIGTWNYTKKHTNFLTFHLPKKAMVWDVMERQSLLSGKMNLKQQFLKVFYVRIDSSMSFPMNYLKRMLVHTYLLQISY